MTFDVVVVAPNTAIDSYYVLPELAVGEVNRAAQVLHTAGGKGNNMARAVALMGGRVLSLGIVGGTSGQFILNELERESITAEMVWTEHETRRTSTIPVPALRQSTVVLENGAPVGHAAREALTAKVLARATKAPFVALTGSLPTDFPDDYYAMLVNRLKDEQVRVTVDCSGRALELAMKAHPAIVKVNVKEFRSTFRMQMWSWQATADIFVSLGVQLLIVTDGAQGAYVFSQESEPFKVATKVDRWVNTTGAGDTFMAGLLVAFNRGMSLEQASRLASSAAASSVQQVCSGFLDQGDVERYLQLTQVETLKREGV
jgi:1-phosphofructokinase family hexose kinase